MAGESALSNSFWCVECCYHVARYLSDFDKFQTAIARRFSMSIAETQCGMRTSSCSGQPLTLAGRGKIKHQLSRLTDEKTK